MKSISIFLAHGHIDVTDGYVLFKCMHIIVIESLLFFMQQYVRKYKNRIGENLDMDV